MDHGDGNDSVEDQLMIVTTWDRGDSCRLVVLGTCGETDEVLDGFECCVGKEYDVNVPALGVRRCVHDTNLAFKRRRYGTITLLLGSLATKAVRWQDAAERHTQGGFEHAQDDQAQQRGQ